MNPNHNGKDKKICRLQNLINRQEVKSNLMLHGDKHKDTFWVWESTPSIFCSH